MTPANHDTANHGEGGHRSPDTQMPSAAPASPSDDDSADRLQLLEIAEEACGAAAAAYYERAKDDAGPEDWRAYTYLSNASRYIAAAMVEVGAVESPPSAGQVCTESELSTPGIAALMIHGRTEP